jgi:ABC-type glycerol-3-phosphate transport system substrate-binding protein
MQKTVGRRFQLSRKLLVISLVLILMGVLAAPLLVLGQSQETILTIAVPDWMNNTIFTPDVFKSFETEHPGVKVVIIGSGETGYIPPAEFALGSHLDMTEAYVNTADVLYVMDYYLSVEATRAGYYLDLAPLVAADATLDEADFFPAVWKSWQWDGGFWGLPVAASPQVLVYNVTAFDEAGLAYPNPDWTLDDLLQAANVLTQHNAEGAVLVPGFEPNFFGELARSVLNEKFYDDTVLPSPPSFARPEVAALMDRWYTWLQEDQSVPGVSGQYEYDQVPMAIDDIARREAFYASPDAVWEASLLPGGTATLQVQGFAVSAGTAYPELAYALAKYLTQQLNITGQLFGALPARQSMMGLTADDGPFTMSEVSPEAQAFQREAMAHALPISELRYAGYLNVVVGRLFDDTPAYDASSALQAAEEQARRALQTAKERRGSVLIVVPTPVPTPVVAPGEVALKFGVTNISPLPQKELWDQAITDFTATDPNVVYINLVTDPTGTVDPIENFDCYYRPYSSSTITGTNGLLNLDPLLNADPNFDPRDVIGSVFDQFRFNGELWAYPLTLRPKVLWYDTEAFSQAGVPMPENGWSVEEFADALMRLKAASPDGMAPFVPDGFGNTYILLLIAAHGGRPFDYHVDPPVVNLTAPETIEAIRQVTNLAGDGYIAYRALDTNAGGGGGAAPLITDTLSTTSWRLGVREATGLPVQLTLYPHSSQVVPVSYEVGAAYISAQTLNPEACYRWIRYLAGRPELFTGMPVSHEQLDSPALAAVLGDDVVEFYREYAAQFDDPNVYVVPFRTRFSQWIEDIWFNQALDHVVLEDGDLETELEKAQTNIIEFRACTADIPLFVSSMSDELNTYYSRFTECAIKIDPNLATRFGPRR